MQRSCVQWRKTGFSQVELFVPRLHHLETSICISVGVKSKSVFFKPHPLAAGCIQLKGIGITGLNCFWAAGTKALCEVLGVPFLSHATFFDGLFSFFFLVYIKADFFFLFYLFHPQWNPNPLWKYSKLQKVQCWAFQTEENASEQRLTWGIYHRA